MSANCLLTIPRYGYARVRATQVAYGMEIVSYAADGESRSGATFYPAKRTDSDFDLTLIFSSRPNYVRINQWLQRYVDWASNPSSVASPVRVTIPDRKFDMTGVLKGGIAFGARVGAITHGMTLSFVGARSSVKLDSGAISTFSGPRNASNDPALTYLYPPGQLKGSEYGWDYVYDEPAGTILLNSEATGPLAQVIPGLGVGVDG